MKKKEIKELSKAYKKAEKGDLTEDEEEAQKIHQLNNQQLNYL